MNTKTTLHPESSSALEAIQTGAGNGKRVVFVSGTFNIVHPGHLRLLRFAAECGDFLVVGVLDERLAQNAQLSEDMRLEGVAAISWVGHAFVLRDPPQDFIAELRPAVVVKGRSTKTGRTLSSP
jgi:cytidyltransferase-like protein